MSPCPSTLQLSPSVCVRLLCLLLLLLSDCSSSVPRRDPVTSESLTRPDTTRANCTTECRDDGVAVNATDLNLSERTQEDHSASSNPAFNDSAVASVTHPSNQQPASLDHLGPSPATSAVPLPSTPTGSTQGAPTGPVTSMGTITFTTPEQVRNATASPVTSKATTPTSTTPTPTSTTPTSTTPTSTTPTSTTPKSTSTTPTTTITTTPTTATSTTTTTPFTPTTTPMPTSTTPTPTTTTTTSTVEPTAKAASHPATTILTRANATATVATTTGTKTSPPPPPSAATPQPNASSTGMPPVQTSLPRGSTTETATSTRAAKPGGVVDVAGAALTSQLVDTASLLAVLLFGLLFFLVTVGVFVMRAYESYRRKDYTQVDYLINGMYSDSGV